LKVVTHLKIRPVG